MKAKRTGGLLSGVGDGGSIDPGHVFAGICLIISYEATNLTDTAGIIQNMNASRPISYSNDVNLNRPRSGAERDDSGAEPDHRTAVEMSGFLKRVLGPRLAALLVGVADTRIIDDWISGESLPTANQEQRLRAACDIVQDLVREESPRAVRSWFLGMNPDLDDRSPAIVFGTEPDLVADVARIFLATG